MKNIGYLPQGHIILFWETNIFETDQDAISFNAATNRSNSSVEV